jgi:hypothetical protein
LNPHFTISVLWKILELFVVVNETHLTNLNNLVIIGHDHLFDPESLNGLNSKVSIVLNQIRHDLLLVCDLNQNSNTVVILEDLFFF